MKKADEKKLSDLVSKQEKHALSSKELQSVARLLGEKKKERTQVEKPKPKEIKKSGLLFSRKAKASTGSGKPQSERVRSLIGTKASRKYHRSAWLNGRRGQTEE